MARTDNLNNFLTDVADAIRTKTGGTEQIQASQFDTEIESINTGITPNGIVESYYAYAGENISAGDFVQFINGAASTETGVSEDVQLGSESQTGYRISAVELPGNRVFIAHSYGSNYYLYGMIVTVNVDKIVVNFDTQLSNVYRSGFAISAKLLKDGRIFIAHSYNSSSYLYGMVCTVGESTIIVHNDISINNESTDLDEYPNIDTVVLENNYVFIAYCMSGYSLGTVVCKINDDNSIAFGARNIGESKGGKGLSALLLPNGYIFVAHTSGNTESLYCSFYSVSDLTITKEATRYIQTATDYNTGSHISTVLLDDGNIFIAHSGATILALYGIVCSISGTTVTAGKDTLITNQYRTGEAISAKKMPNGKIFIVHSHTNNSWHLYGVICSVSGTTITFGTDTPLENVTTNSGKFIDTVLFSNGYVFAAHSKGSTYNLNAQIWGADEINNVPTNVISAIKYETQVKVATSTPFDGIAKTSGTGGTEELHNEQVEIYTLQG